MNLPIKPTIKPTPDDLERYRGYLKLLAQMQLSPKLQVKEDASDIVQQVMLTACTDLCQFNGQTERELKAWLTKIALNVIAGRGRHYSRQRRDIAREEPLAMSLEQSSAVLHRSLIGNEPSPSEGAIASEEVERLTDALMQLSEAERTAIVLKHLHGLTLEEIAERLGCSSNSVGGLLNKGLHKLRSYLCK
ncbi:MAG: sigma-70 family RNA polymerase sigma factor [Pirellulaceae bacterium]|nr:sigma-70 family RNA polymerase sigma factor [Pirellulaceae bacterium]